MRTHTYTARSRMPAPPEELFAWHLRDGALERLLPPWQHARVVRQRGSPATHGEVDLRFRLAGVPVRFGARHTEFEPNTSFRDEQRRGPFRRWRHTHQVRPAPTDDSSALLEDRVDYALPADRIVRRAIERELERMFAFRHDVTAHDLKRHQQFAALGLQRIAITGASGLIGSALRAYLGTAGHQLMPVVRRHGAGPETIFWDPQGGEIDAERFERLDAVIHLAGANVGKRWSAEHKRAIRESRSVGTRLLCETLARLSHKPRVLISASATGYYGDRGDELLDENSAPGDDFLASVCREWEAATEPARDAGIRVVNLRIGMVLTPGGGGLERMLPAFRLGVGGRIGSGRQWMSWIALDDLLGVFEYAMFEERLEGPVNATSPGPVTNAEFARTLGKVLRRPALLPVPSFAVKAAFGEMGEALVLSGARVMPKKLQEAGFEFFWPDLESALRHLLGRNRLESVSA